MNVKMKMKNRSHRYNISWVRFRHGQKYSKYKKCLSIIMLICIKQHLSNIWSSIHEKGWVPYKKACRSKKPNEINCTILLRHLVSIASRGYTVVQAALLLALSYLIIGNSTGGSFSPFWNYNLDFILLWLPTPF